VPKGALKAVLGRELGERAWRHARGRVRWPESEIREEEVVAGLVRHLSLRASEELRKAGRGAKFVRLTVWLRGARSTSGRTRLPLLTQEAGDIQTAAEALLRGFTVSPALVESIDLDVTAAGDLAAEPGGSLTWLAASVQAAPA
jgi:hypothetical protein